jgi:hypothetical protein
VILSLCEHRVYLHKKRQLWHHLVVQSLGPPTHMWSIIDQKCHYGSVTGLSLYTFPWKFCCQSLYLILSKRVLVWASSIIELACTNLRSGAHFSQNLYSMTSCWQLAIDHTRNSYTMENGKYYKSGLWGEENFSKHNIGLTKKYRL